MPTGTGSGVCRAGRLLVSCTHYTDVYTLAQLTRRSASAASGLLRRYYVKLLPTRNDAPRWLLKEGDLKPGLSRWHGGHTGLCLYNLPDCSARGIRVGSESTHTTKSECRTRPLQCHQKQQRDAARHLMTHRSPLSGPAQSSHSHQPTALLFPHRTPPIHSHCHPPARTRPHSGVGQTVWGQEAQWPSGVGGRPESSCGGALDSRL